MANDPTGTPDPGPATGDTTATTEPTGTLDAGKTLTQADVDRIVGERLARQKAQYADYEDLKLKAAAADSNKTDMERLTEQMQALAEENETNKVKALRSEVASTKGLPATLLTAKTEDDLNKQADDILAFAQAQTKAAAATTLRPKEALVSGSAGSDKADLDREGVLNAVLGRNRTK